MHIERVAIDSDIGVLGLAFLADFPVAHLDLAAKLDSIVSGLGQVLPLLGHIIFDRGYHIQKTHIGSVMFDGV